MPNLSYNSKFIATPVIFIISTLIMTGSCRSYFNRHNNDMYNTNKHEIFTDHQINTNINENGAGEPLQTNFFPPFYHHQTNELPEGVSSGGAPKYMLELYKKFETDRYSHPMANIVRSFVNMYEGKWHSNYTSKQFICKIILVFLYIMV